ncbi:hypothetical protein V6N12_039897 [Hibiscus sabdariffa]|uniref:Phytocyanin domain-containing protein n=1 Tax=Hibiscus sabdariffa TaxID=183260 RepID=A0ABR2E236_9ROSI
MNGSVEASKQFTVGDHIGWKQPSSNNSDVYTLWATSKRFHVGDSLSFEYDRNDSVLVVDKWDYYHCNSNNPIYSFNDGSNVVNLDRPGSFYFISGILDHCKNGEKLMIQVMGLHQGAEPPPATANPREETTTIVGDGSTQEAVNIQYESFPDQEPCRGDSSFLLLRTCAVLLAAAVEEEGIEVGGDCTLLRLAAKVDAIKETFENDEQKVMRV